MKLVKVGLSILPLLFLCSAAPNISAELIWGREGVSDYLDVVAEDGIYNWPQEKFPVRVYIEPGNGTPGYRASYPAILKASLDEWVLASGHRLAWVETDRRDSADIACSWTADAPEREAGTEAGRTRTYTRFDTESNHGTIYRATMALATRLPDREMSDDEIKKTFLHEVGHAFGIAGHSPESTDIMFARVSPRQSSFLSARDRSTIARLYASYPRRQPLAQNRPAALRQRA